jgi:hypothetical protein
MEDNRFPFIDGNYAFYEEHFFENWEGRKGNMVGETEGKVGSS